MNNYDKFKDVFQFIVRNWIDLYIFYLLQDDYMHIYIHIYMHTYIYIYIIISYTVYIYIM